MKKAYIVFLDMNIMQDVSDIIDSIWFSERKANKRRNKLIKNDEYEEGQVVILVKEISI
jgi:hypothetical protein